MYIGEFTKQQDEVELAIVSYAGLLSSETITQVDVEPTGVSVDRVLSGNDVHLLVSGGGVENVIRLTATTSKGRVLKDLLKVRIVSEDNA